MIRSRVLALACALVPAGALAAPSNQVQALRREIAALQLDHALDLTPQQAQALLPQLRDAKAKVDAFHSQRTATEPARVAALTQAVADLKANGSVSASTLDALQAARAGARGPLRDELRSFWQQAMQVLTADQLQALKSAKLGLGPARSPTEAGPMGAPGHRHLGRRLLVLRTLLSDDFVSLVQARAG